MYHILAQRAFLACTLYDPEDGDARDERASPHDSSEPAALTPSDESESEGAQHVVQPAFDASHDAVHAPSLLIRRVRVQLERAEDAAGDLGAV